MLCENATPQLRKALPPVEYCAVQLWLQTFFPFQQRWLLDWSRFALISKARQIGASHTMAAAAVLWSMLGDTSTVISIGEREAVEVLDKAARHAKALELLGSKWAHASTKSTEVRLASGGRVIALPSTSGGRSYSGNVILDEAAYHQRPEQVWDGAGGTVLHGYKLRAMSTPNGVGNMWHRLFNDPRAHKGYARHEVTIDDARNDGMQVNEEECWRMARQDPRVYDQLFRCKFLDGDAQYIPSSLIDAACVDDNYCYEGDCYAGLDIGRTVDLSALVIVRKRPHDGALFVQHIETRSRTSEDDLVAMVHTALGPPWNARRVVVDATGMGAFPAERLQRVFGQHKIEPFVFTPRTKEDLATTLYQNLAEERVRILRTEQKLRDDIASIRRIVTSAGNIRYDAPHTDDGHADRAWALALALHGCSGAPRTKYEFGPGTE